MRNFYEEYANQCITHLFSDFGWSLKLNHHDPPDLYDEDNSVGIEVTRAIDEKDAELDSIYADYKSENINDVKSTLLNKINRKQSHLVTENNKIVACIHKPRRLDYEVINNALEKKTQSLKHNTNGLFIYNSGAFFFDNGIEIVNSKIGELRTVYEKSFDYIFIYSDHDIVLMDENSKMNCQTKCNTVEK